MNEKNLHPQPGFTFDHSDGALFQINLEGLGAKIKKNKTKQLP